ncbi:MAG: SDR family oxidoreductase [Aliidongia sp.]
MQRIFENKTVAITGASDGIGRELALQLGTLGANLVVAARNGTKLAAVVAECRERAAQAIAVETDVADEPACRRLIDAAAQAFGGIDILVNNAGQSMHARLDEVTDLGIFEQLMRVNYLGAVYCTTYALPHLRRSRGLLVAVSSLQGKTGFPGSSGYAASKYAMQGFFDSLRIELMGSGVDVSASAPAPWRPRSICIGWRSTAGRARQRRPRPADKCRSRTAPVRSSAPCSGATAIS